MIVGRIVGLILILIGLAVAGRDTLASVSLGELDILELGQIWYEWHRGSLNGFQAGTERYISVWLWDSVFAPMLFWPAAIYPIVPGILLFLFCRPRGEHRSERRFFSRRR